MQANGETKKKVLGSCRWIPWESSFVQEMPDPTRMFSLLVIAIIHVRYFLQNDHDFWLTFQGFALNPYAIFSFALGVFAWVMAPNTKALPVYDRWTAEWYWWNGWFFHILLDGFTGSLLLIPVSVNQYQTMDSRFINNHSVPWAVGLIELFVMGPLCLVLYWTIVKHHPLRFPLELVVTSIQIMGMILFMATEIYEGQLNIPAQDPVGVPGNAWANLKFNEYHLTYYWFAFWICNTIWSYVPYFHLQRALQECVAALKEHRD